MAEHEIVLHHYDASPFSEKARLMFGLKGLAWRSAITPSMMPKPDLTPLTGGYRRAPVMQIGADIFCDSQVILAEIEARHPAPAAEAGLPWAVNLWADRLFFMVTVPIIFGEIGEAVPRPFIEDREKLSGRPFDAAAMKAASGPMQGQWRAQAAWARHCCFIGPAAAFICTESNGRPDSFSRSSMNAFGTSISPKMIGTVAPKNSRSAHRFTAHPAPSSGGPPARAAISAMITWLSQ